MTFDIQDILIFAGAMQGIFLVAALLKIQKRNPLAIRHLSLFLLVTALTLTGRLIYMSDTLVMGARLSLLLDSVIFVFGPLLYTYLSRATYGQRINKPWLHYVPVAIHLSIAIYHYSFTEAQYVEKLASGQLYVLFIFIEGSALVLNSYYVIQSFKLLFKYKHDEALLLSYKHKLVSYLQLFLVAVSICLVGWWASFLTAKLLDLNLAIIGYNSVWIGIAICSYIIGYYCLTQPDIFTLEGTSQRKVSKRLTEQEIDELTERIEQALQSEKVFLEPKLTLADFAEHIDARTHDVSWLLNNVYQKSFYDFINHHRVEEFLGKVNKKEHEAKTILALSYEVGFNSKSTFNKAFKIAKEDTPSQYIKKLQGAC